VAYQVQPGSPRLLVMWEKMGQSHRDPMGHCQLTHCLVPERPQTPQTTPTSNNAKQADLGQFFSQKKSRPEPQQPKPDYPHPSPYVDGYHAPSMVDHATVTSLETMLGWPKHYRTALQQKMPPHFLQFLKNRVENSSYSTCFSGVDAPGSVAGAGNGCSFVLTGGCK